MKVRAVWQFFEAERDGNRFICSSRGREPLHSFRFGRQPQEDGLCLGDYILEADESGRDHLALFVVTAGEGVRERPRKRRRRASMSGARAAGARDRNRRRLRRMAAPPHPRGLGLSRSAVDDDAGALHLALPRQALQLRLSCVSRISTTSRASGSCCGPKRSASQLTEGMMMEPEASVSALVFHHPDCAYFTVAETAEEDAA